MLGGGGCECRGGGGGSGGGAEEHEFICQSSDNMTAWPSVTAEYIELSNRSEHVTDLHNVLF